MEPTPFPFASLPAVSRIAVDLGRRLRAAIATGPLASELAGVLSELAGEPVGLAIRQVGALDVARVRPDAVATIFVPPDAVGLRGGVLAFGESALAAALVARALRQRAPRIVDASRIVPAVAGAFAATLHAVVRRTSATPWRVAAAGPLPALARDLDAMTERVLHAALVVTIGADHVRRRYRARGGFAPPAARASPVGAPRGRDPHRAAARRRVVPRDPDRARLTGSGRRVSRPGAVTRRARSRSSPHGARLASRRASPPTVGSWYVSSARAGPGTGCAGRTRRLRR